MGRTRREVNLERSVDVDKIRIERDIFLANAFVIELPLDSQPDYVWQTLFELEWKSSLHLWERKAAIVGDKLLLITTPTDIEEKIDWLRSVIESVNLRVGSLTETQKAVEEMEEAEELRRHENIIRDALRMKLAML